MAIDKDSNVYTIAFATVMVIVVGGLLAFVSMSLKPMQQANVKNEKMQNILQAIGIEETNGVTREEAGAKFNEFITRRVTINFKGEILSDKTAADAIDAQDKIDAFNIDLRKEYSRYVKPIMSKNKGDDAAIKAALTASADIHFPIFVCEHNGEKYFIVSASGKGLWDDVWGYLCIKSDGSTINGAVFDHKTETAGLGSKINETWFEEQFIGKTMSENNAFSPVSVEKPGKDLNNHQVDGISGATFTGVGVNEMLERNLAVYYNFFKNNADFVGGSSSQAEPSNDMNNESIVNDSSEVSLVSTLPFTGAFSEDFDLFLQNYDGLVAGDEKSFVIEGIKFSAGSSNINVKSSTETLNRIVEGLKTMTDVEVELSGHTDNLGEEAALLTLSESRANAVKKYLVENGIEEERVQAVGYGGTMPVGSNDTQEGRDANKRTEIKIIKSNLTANIN